jgi:hypothetical protein
MKIQTIKPSDTREIYDSFMSAQVTRENCLGRKSGFYEYALSFKEMQKRVGLSAQEGLGLTLRDNKKLFSYLITYRKGQAEQIDDEVLSAVSVHDDAIYADQFFISSGLPVYIAGRVLDSWNNLAYSREQRGLFSAVAWKPWRNLAAAKFNMCRGGKVSGFVREGDLSLAIFTNPLWRLGENPRQFEIEFKREAR